MVSREEREAAHHAFAHIERLTRMCAKLEAERDEALARLARVRAEVEALPPAMPHDRAIRRAAVLALLDRDGRVPVDLDTQRAYMARPVAPEASEAGERMVQALRDVLHQNVRGILLSTGIPVRERQYAIQTLVDVGAAFGILDVDEVGGAERFLKEGA